MSAVVGVSIERGLGIKGTLDGFRKWGVIVLAIHIFTFTLRG
jgi:hypothetical protein